MKNIEDINILLVDDHHMILEGYKRVLSKANFINYNLYVYAVDNCDHAWDMVREEDYQIIFLDINFPIHEKRKILSGEDLGIKLSKEFPKVKIIILTLLEDAFRLRKILSNINPDGFLLKGETTAMELLNCLERVITSPPYYGSKISKLLNSEFTQNYSIDETDRMMLYQLSLGTKTKDIGKFVNLSYRAVENRKKKLKEVFGVSNEGNKALLEKAKKSGYI